MKRVLLLFILCSSWCLPQQLYQSSVALRNAVGTKDYRTFFSVLKASVPRLASCTSTGEMVTLLQENHHLFALASRVDSDIQTEFINILKNLDANLATKEEERLTLSATQRTYGMERDSLDARLRLLDSTEIVPEQGAGVLSTKEKRERWRAERHRVDSIVHAAEERLERLTTEIAAIKKKQVNTPEKYSRLNAKLLPLGLTADHELRFVPSVGFDGHSVTPSVSVQAPVQHIVVKSETDLQTSMIDASARFIAGRVKEEVSLEFLRRFRGYFTDTTSKPTLKALFPATTAVFRVVDEGHLSNAFDLLKNAFNRDLSEIHFTVTEHVITVLNNSGAMDDRRRMIQFLSVEGRMIRRTLQGLHPLDALDRVTEEIDSSSALSITRFIVELGKALYTERPAYRRWISTEEFERFSSDDTLQSILFGLLYERLAGFHHGPVRDLMKLSTNELAAVCRGYYHGFASVDARVERMAKSQRDGQPIPASELFDFTMQTGNLLATAFTRVFDPAAAESTRRILNDLYQAQYAAMQGDFSMTFSYGMSVLSRLATVKDFGDVVQYGSFMATVAQAKSAEDIQKAIEAAALPPGSYTIKRTSELNWSLNIYPGATAGYEGIVTDRVRHGALNFGLTVPVGFAFSWGLQSSCLFPKESSFSLFVSVFDLAAPVNFRLLQDKDEQLPGNLKFTQLVSPGVYCIYGLPKSVFSIAVGVSIVPQLRDVTIDNISLEQKNALRLNISAMFDLPVFNFYTQPF